MTQTVHRSLAAIFAVLATHSQGQSLRLTEIAPLAGGKVRISATASSTAPITLEASADLKNWSALQTFPANTTSVSFTDTAGVARFYRLSVGATSQSPNPTPLTDLATLPNRVFEAPENLNTIQFAPDGKLAYIAWRDQSLIVRERSASGDWTEQTLNSSGNIFKMLTAFDFSGPRDDYRFQPSAALLYDSQSRAHVFQASGTSIIHYTRNSATTWIEAERISDPQANANISVLEATIGANDVIHFAALSAGTPRNLTYGSNRGGSWNWRTISTVTDVDPTYWAPPFAPRWLSMAVDANNNAHIAYRSSMDITRDSGGHPRAHSVLKYASNAGGYWITDKIVMNTFDDSGEAANGASIAIASDGKPRIVSWYDERADSGSAQESRMYFHQQDASGNWSWTMIGTSADGYIAEDGNKGTGFSPHLRYDNQGRAHIVFLDHAGQHFSGIGQQEFAGNLRHAWWNGSGWSFETIYRQTNPLLQQIVYPTFAISGSEMAITFLERGTQWNLSSFPPMSNSTYVFRFMTKPLP